MFIYFMSFKFNLFHELNWFFPQPLKNFFIIFRISYQLWFNMNFFVK